MVTYGRTCPQGSLPVFSVDTEEEAKRLIVSTCGTNLNGEYVAKELVNPDGSIPEGDERLDRFFEFGKRLEEVYHKHIKKPAQP